MTTILHYAGARFELADTENPERVEMLLARSDDRTQRFELADGGTIDVHGATRGAWVIEIRSP